MQARFFIASSSFGGIRPTSLEAVRSPDVLKVDVVSNRPLSLRHPSLFKLAETLSSASLDVFTY
jgi:hypothetical protein